jgi:hypothetical protein
LKKREVRKLLAAKVGSNAKAKGKRLAVKTRRKNLVKGVMRRRK